MATETKDKEKDVEEAPKLDRENPPEGYEKTPPGGEAEPKSKKAKE